LGYYGKQLGNDWNPPDGVASIDLDDAIDASQVSDGSFDLNLGAYFFKPGEYYIGLSATHLTSQDLNDLNIEMATHLYFMAGYIYPINDDFKIRPNLLVKSDANETTLDFNANVLWNNMLWAGLSFRTEDALAPMLGFQTSWNNEDETLPQTIRVGYSYDVTTSEIKNYSSGSHEIMVTYCFSVIDKILMKKHYNPRFL
jgi:type IX secretion system PorP/SprF family membrane protein